MRMTQKEFDDFVKNVEIVPEQVVYWRTRVSNIGSDEYTSIICPKCDDYIRIKNFRGFGSDNKFARRLTYCGNCGAQNIIHGKDEDEIGKTKFLW